MEFLDYSQLNFYCDESCHLEHDNNSQYMVLGTLVCSNSEIKEINNRIKEIKIENGISAFSEVKWKKITEKNVQLYKDLVNFFFDKEKALRFRAVIVDKNKLTHKEHNQTHEDFYYKMYYYLLIHWINPLMKNKIYVDQKDSNNKKRIDNLEKSLCVKMYDYNHDTIMPIQIIKSHTIQIMQIVDIIIGALSYNFNKTTKRNCKESIIEILKKRSRYNLERSTLPSESKFNIMHFPDGEANV